MENEVLNNKAIGQRLVSLRGNRTQEEVAKALGISKSALCMYESGDRMPRDPIKLRIARYYGRSVPFIFFNPKDHEK